MTVEVLQSIADGLVATALRYPEAVEDHPWGDRVVKVNKKIFAFAGVHGDVLGVSVKLPSSAAAALALPFTKPTGYGLGKAGWISASFAAGDSVPVPLLEMWIDESYRAVAPKKLVKALDGGGK